jgi:hypothetical protein
VLGSPPRNFRHGKHAEISGIFPREISLRQAIPAIPAKYPKKNLSPRRIAC